MIRDGINADGFRPCMCGDSQCPSCGLAQGTLDSVPPQATSDVPTPVSELPEDYFDD